MQLFQREVWKLVHVLLSTELFQIVLWLFTGTGNYTVEVMLLRYLDLNHVPFRFDACSDQCQAAILQHYRELQTELQNTLDKEYADTIKQANKLVRNDEVDISTNAVGAPPPRRRRRRGRLMCAIM